MKALEKMLHVFSLVAFGTVPVQKTIGVHVTYCTSFAEPTWLP